MSKIVTFDYQVDYIIMKYKYPMSILWILAGVILEPLIK